MPGVIVTGEVGLIDAAVVRFLRSLRLRYSPVFVAPSRAAFAPAVDLSAVHYVLGQLLCVEKVLVTTEEASAGFEVVSFPREIVERAREVIHTRVPDDDELVQTCLIDQLISQRPSPLILLTGCFDLIH